MSKTPRTEAQIAALRKMQEARAQKRRDKVAQGLPAALTLRDALVAAVDTRVAKLTERGEHVATEWARIRKSMTVQGFENQLAALQGAVDLSTLLAAIPRHKNETTKEGYVQAKTVEKALKVIDAFFVKQGDKMGDFIVQVLVNALHNGGALSLSSAQASLSRRVAGNTTETLVSRAGYTPGTASSQASQVREVMRLMGLASTIKGKRDDVMHLAPERIETLREFFATRDEAVTTEGDEGDDE